MSSLSKNYFDLARTVLADPGTAERYYWETEALLCSDPFNPSLIFANGMASFQRKVLNVNFIQGINLAKKRPDWVPQDCTDQHLQQFDFIINKMSKQDQNLLKTWAEPSFYDFPVKEIDPARDLGSFLPSEMVNLSSSNIDEYSRYRVLFDANYDAPCFTGFPETKSDGTFGYDLKLEISENTSLPLVIFFQGFFTCVCPENLRIPSFQTPFSQEGMCSRIDAKRMKFNRIFVRDHFQMWYQAGLHGRGSPATLAKQLSTIIESLRPSRIITYGVSAGGFASLLFGQLLGADKCISFSPQSVILADSPGSFMSNYRYLFTERFLKGRPYVYDDIAKFESGNTQARVFFSSQCEGDRYHALRLKHLKWVEIISKQSDSHGGYLDKKLAKNELLAALA